MAIKPTEPTIYGSYYAWRLYARDLAAYEVAVAKEAISTSLRDVLPSDTAKVVRQVAGLPSVPRNPLYSVTVTRARVRAANADAAESMVRDALAGVSFTDASDVRRNFRYETTITASKINE